MIRAATGPDAAQWACSHLGELCTARTAYRIAAPFFAQSTHAHPMKMLGATTQRSRAQPHFYHDAAIARIPHRLGVQWA